VVEVYNGTRIKQAMNLLSKHAKFWSNESHWEWATKPNPREGFCLKIFCRCKKAGNLILSKGEGDYLEQSELGFGFFLLMVIR
jgi:hypothetical protein